MEIVNTLLEEISAHSFEVGSWTWVDVLHINNPHSFYIRPRTYSKYLPLLQTRGDHPKASEVKVDDVFVFKSKTLKCNVRGTMVYCNTSSSDEPTYKMFAIDIGCTEDDVPLSSIWTTRYPLPVPSLVTHCRLADCAPQGETWDVCAIDAMRSYVEGERAKMIVRSKIPNKLVVELCNSRPDDIATLLALTNYTSFGYVHNDVTLDCVQESSQYYANRELQVGEVIHVRMLSGILLDQFYVTPVDEYQTYLNDRNDYTSYARTISDLYIENLKLNSPVGVLYHKYNKFERGLVKELLPEFNRAKVYLVDLGTMIEESVMKMKAVPDWYLRVPPRALWCTLHSSQPFINGVATLTYPGSEFQITIMRLGDKDMTRPNIVKIFQ